MSSRSMTSGCGSGGNGSSARNCNKKNPATHHKPQTNVKFHGACKALKDHVFDCLDYKQANRYATTIKRVAEYVGSEYKNGGDMCALILAETKYNIPRLTVPTIANAGQPTPDEQIKQHLYEKLQGQQQSLLPQRGLVAC